MVVAPLDRPSCRGNDLDPCGLRFVSATKDGTRTVTLSLSGDPAAQARDHEGPHHAL